MCTPTCGPIYPYLCSGRRKSKHDLTLSGFWFSVHSSNSYQEKRNGGRQESTMALNGWWDLSFCQFFITQLKNIFFFKRLHSFYFFCWIYNVPKWFANVLLFLEGLTPCHHYLWNGAFLSENLHWNLCIKVAEDWILHIISQKLEIKNRKWALGSTSCLSHSSPLMAFFFPQEREGLEGNRICVIWNTNKCKNLVHIFFSFFFSLTACFVCLKILILRKDFSRGECGSL